MARSKTARGDVALKTTGLILAAALFSMVVLHRYVFAIYVIQGSSMSPTLSNGDTALVNMSIWLRLEQLDRGEIVLVRDGLGGFATKRIVGLPRERIRFQHGQVFVNERRLREAYLDKDASTESERTVFELGPNDYFVLGDNRADSYDSRIYGPVRKEAIVGSYTRTFWACR
jgi:signal peptidase I